MLPFIMNNCCYDFALFALNFEIIFYNDLNVRLASQWIAHLFHLGNFVISVHIYDYTNINFVIHSAFFFEFHWISFDSFLTFVSIIENFDFYIQIIYLKAFWDNKYE